MAIWFLCCSSERKKSQFANFNVWLNLKSALLAPPTLPSISFSTLFFRFDVWSIGSVSRRFYSTLKKSIAFTWFNGMRKKRHSIFVDMFRCERYVEIWAVGVHKWLIQWPIFSLSLSLFPLQFHLNGISGGISRWMQHVSPHTHTRTHSIHINYAVWIELHISSYMQHIDRCTWYFMRLTDIIINFRIINGKSWRAVFSHCLCLTLSIRLIFIAGSTLKTQRYSLELVCRLCLIFSLRNFCCWHAQYARHAPSWWFRYAEFFDCTNKTFLRDMTRQVQF